MQMDKMLSACEAAKMLGVTNLTLKRWDAEGKFKASFRTAGGHKRYSLLEIEEFTGKSKTDTSKQVKVFVYCRVSTKKQESAGNLERQKERLLVYCKEKSYNVIEVFSEVASGINENRRQLGKMLKRVHEIDKIVIEYEDRLARFGFRYLLEHAKAFDTEIEAIEKNDQSSTDDEMIKDIINIITRFTASIYGARGGKKVRETLMQLGKEEYNSENHN